MKLIKLLPAIIILVFFGSVNALIKDDGTSDSIIEATFDLMVTVLIASVITIDVDRIKKTDLLIKIFDKSAYIFFPLLGPLQMWFCIRGYISFHDFFFIAYLIVKLTIGIIPC